MSLLNNASAANRVTAQGNTYSFTNEPAQQFATIQSSAQGSGIAVGDRVSILQWRVTAHLAKRYSYVGLSRAAAEWIADKITEAYTVNMTKYALGLFVDPAQGVGYYKFLPVEGGGVPTCCASVTPTHEDGTMWNVEVDVDATVEAYYDTAPTLAAIKALFAEIADFPEIASPNTAITYAGASS